MRLSCKLPFQCESAIDGRAVLSLDDVQWESGAEGIPIMHDPVLHRADVARLLNVSVKTVDRRVKDPKNPLPMKKRGGRLYILASELRKYLTENPEIFARFKR